MERTIPYAVQLDPSRFIVVRHKCIDKAGTNTSIHQLNIVLIPSRIPYQSLPQSADPQFYALPAVQRGSCINVETSRAAVVARNLARVVVYHITNFCSTPVNDPVVAVERSLIAARKGIRRTIPKDKLAKGYPNRMFQRAFGLSFLESPRKLRSLMPPQLRGIEVSHIYTYIESYTNLSPPRPASHSRILCQVRSFTALWIGTTTLISLFSGRPTMFPLVTALPPESTSVSP